MQKCDQSFNHMVLMTLRLVHGQTVPLFKNKNEFRQPRRAWEVKNLQTRNCQLRCLFNCRFFLCKLFFKEWKIFFHCPRWSAKTNENGGSKGALQNIFASIQAECLEIYNNKKQFSMLLNRPQRGNKVYSQCT